MGGSGGGGDTPQALSFSALPAAQLPSAAMGWADAGHLSPPLSGWPGWLPLPQGVPSEGTAVLQVSQLNLGELLLRLLGLGRPHARGSQHRAQRGPSGLNGGIRIEVMPLAAAVARRAKQHNWLNTNFLIVPLRGGFLGGIFCCVRNFLTVPEAEPVAQGQEGQRGVRG